MEASTKKTLGSFAIIAVLGGGFLLIKKGRKLLSGSKLQFAFIGFRIHRMNMKEAQFAVKLRCYNPRHSPISISINQVVANYKGAAIAYSTPDIKGNTIQAGSTHEPEILFQVPYLNLVGKGVTAALFQNIEQLKADLTFTLTLTVNGEQLTTTQSLTEDNMSGLALGELGIVSGPRNTQNGKQFNHLIKKATGQDKFIKNGNVIETVESCIDTIASHFREVEELASSLEVDSVKETCRNIFDFSYKYLQYHKDADGTEQLRTPARSWLDGQIAYKQQGNMDAGIDCDDYSIFVGSLLKCLGIPFKLRITKYDGKTNFQHIYVIVPDKDDSEGEIVIDPVLSKFDYQVPYSFEQSNFDMSPLEQVAGLRGVDGLTGTSSLGLPISVLSGIDMNGGSQADYEDLMAIVSGVDFDDAINGLGTPEDATLRYLIRTRNFLSKEENQAKMAHIQNPTQFVAMIDQAIKHWHSSKRDEVLDKLANIEEQLVANGLIKYDSSAIQGVSELDELDNEVEGLGRSTRRKGRFFKAVKQASKKGRTVTKKAVKAVVRYNPLSVAIRGGLLAALRLNMFGISKKLQYAYLPDELASKYKVNPRELAKLKKVHHRVVKLFKGLQGKEANLKKAILNGAKQKSNDFSLKGMEGILGDLQSLTDLEEIGSLGVVATAASVSAASGVLAKIGSWLKPIKDLYSKVSNTPAITEYPQAQQYVSPSASIPNVPYQAQALTPSPNTSTIPQSMPPMQQAKKGISKKGKIGLGIGVAALITTGVYFLFRNDEAQAPKRHSPSTKKKSLGAIQLH